MPNRMLRDWTQSDRVNSISANSERFFTRLIMKVDDFGCFYADTRLLKANLFPLLLDSIREADLLRWMAECQKAGLIVIYENTGKKYVQILDFKQRLDRAKSKFPQPIENEPVNECPANDNELRAEQNRSRTEVEEEVEANGGNPLTHTPDEISLFEKFKSFILKDAPNVGKMKEPFTIDEFFKLKAKYSSKEIADTVQGMHNYKPLLQKNICAYLTFLNWKKRDYSSDTGVTTTGSPSINDHLKAAKKQLQNEPG